MSSMKQRQLVLMDSFEENIHIKTIPLWFIVDVKHNKYQKDIQMTYYCK